MPRNLLIPTLLLRACVLAGALLPLSAVAAERLTLAEAVRRATQLAPGLDAQRAAIEAAQAEASRAGALPDPMLSIGIDNLPVTGADAFDPSVDDMTMKRIGVRQEFPSARKRATRVALAQRRVGEAEAMAVAARLEVQREAALAWIDAWQAQREITVLEALREQAQAAARLARARAGAGAGSLADALAADAAVLGIDTELEQARGERDVATARLGRWLPGADADAIEGDPSFDALPVARAQLLARLDALAPVLGSGARVESAAAAIAAARAEKRPDWSVMAAYGQRDRDRGDMVSIEVGIALPVFARQRQDRGVLAREAEYRQALAQRDDERRALAAQVDAAFARWEALKRQVALHETRLLPLAADRSAAALGAYRGGGDLQPWLDARAAELEIHRTHAGHLGELGRAWAGLAFLLPEASP